MRSHKDRSFHLLGGAAIAAISLAAAPALAEAADAAAAPADAGAPALAEVVVTATKGAAVSVQNAPITVQALTGGELASIGAIDFNDFYRLVPGVSVYDNGPGDKRYVIRGVASAGAATVGVYLDDVVITAENAQDGGGQQFDVPLFDMQRVEVLKGPQGTTFGSSSTAGTIRYITNKPDLSKWEEDFRVSGVETAGAAFGPELDGAVNIPVVTDTFAVRLSGYYQNTPGWIDSTFEKGVNTQETEALRGQFKWAITDRLTLSGMTMYESTTLDGRSYESAYDYNFEPVNRNFYQPILAREPFKERANIYSGVLEYKPDYGTFTLTASEFRRNLDFERDASLAAQAYIGPSDTGAGRSTLTQPKTRTVDSFEGRFSSNFSGPVQILAGGYYQYESRYFQSVWVTDNPNGFPMANPSYYLDRTVADTIKEEAAFAEITWHITPKLQVVAGGRYYNFSIHEISDAIYGFGGSPGSGVGNPEQYNDSGAIGRFNISYDLTPTFKLYAQVAQGYRSGGTNDQTSAEIIHVSIPAGYGSDSLINYEAGVKTSWFDKRLFADVAIYHVDWSNIQLQLQAGGQTASFPYTGNGGAAQVDGIETTLELHPIHGLTLSSGLNYNYARLTTNNPIPSTGLAENLLPYVPRTAASLSGDYTWPLEFKGLEGHLGAEVTYTSKTATDLNASIADYRELKAYQLVNLHAGVSKDKWSLTVSVQNLFDDQTIVSYAEVIEGLYPDAYITNRPRTVMMTLAGKF
jgi:outer membrane receptor protein involved in Fe transport